jgi:phage terminase large subunit GpA-like protein
MTALHTAIKSGLQSAIPSALTVSEWAAEYRVISPERVANPANAGRWKNEKTPYLVAIMDAVLDPAVNEILFLKSSQVGGTEAASNMIGYYAHIDPANILYVAETEPKARAYSSEMIAPMIRDTPVLREIFGEAKMRDSTNKIEARQFRGGFLFMGWATSPATLSSRPIRILILDEADAYEANKEGDAAGLAEARLKTGEGTQKTIRITTPRTKETSRVISNWIDSTQEKYFVPCPHCGVYQFLKWANVKWDNNPIEAYYVCGEIQDGVAVAGCGAVIDHDEKFEMLARGEWRTTNPEYQGNARGFWINEIYSPFTTWGSMATAFLKANREKAERNNTQLLQVFVNTQLAEWWEEEGEKLDFGDLTWHREKYPHEVPDGVLALTAGVDVQGDRLECEVVGWGRDLESWSIRHEVLIGDPALADVWDDLYDLLSTEFNGSDGTHRVAVACIDTGGHHADEVYKFAKANAGRKWRAIKGANTRGNPIVSKPSKNNKAGVWLWMIGTDTAKDQIFSFLKIEEFGPGYCHFPDTYSDKYFQQLCAEKKMLHYYRGQPYYQYEKVNIKGEQVTSVRNEALDLRVYATAAREISKFTGQDVPKSRNRFFKPRPVEEKDDGEAAAEPTKKPQLIIKNGGGGGFATNY